MIRKLEPEDNTGARGQAKAVTERQAARDAASRARTIQSQERLLSSLRTGATVTVACKAAKVGHTTYYRWRDEDPAFRAKADASLDEVLDEVARHDVGWLGMVQARRDGRMDHRLEAARVRLAFAAKCRRKITESTVTQTTTVKITEDEARDKVATRREAFFSRLAKFMAKGGG